MIASRGVYKCEPLHKFYQKQSGKNPVTEFLNDLPSDELARIAGCLKNIEELGFDSPRVQFRQIKGSLWEIKIKTSRSGYRFFMFAFKKKLLCFCMHIRNSRKKHPNKRLNLLKNA